MASETSTETSSLSPIQSAPPNQNLQLCSTIKLTSTNFLLWKTQLIPILRSNNLLGIVNGTEPCPPAPIIDSAAPSASTVSHSSYTLWLHREQLALSCINESLSEGVLPIVVGQDHSFGAWIAINQAFGAASHTRILQLHMQLQNLKKDDKSITVFLQEAKYLSDELAVVGKPLNAAEFNAIVFNNLGPNYHPVVAAISTRSTPILYPELLSILTSEEIRQSTMVQRVELPSAHLTQRNRNGSPNFSSYGSSNSRELPSPHTRNSFNTGRNTNGP